MLRGAVPLYRRPDNPLSFLSTAVVLSHSTPSGRQSILTAQERPRAVCPQNSVVFFILRGCFFYILHASSRQSILTAQGRPRVVCQQTRSFFILRGCLFYILPPHAGGAHPLPGAAKDAKRPFLVRHGGPQWR